MLTFNQFKTLKQNQYCYYTGIKLTNNGDNQFTLDRIDNTVGYTFENTVACCLAVNQFKNRYFEVKKLDQHPFFIAIKSKLDERIKPQSKFKRIIKILFES